MRFSQPNHSECLAYCSSCRGVTPMTPSGRQVSCPRCGMLYRRSDPGAAIRRQASRYLLYGLLTATLPAGVVVAVGAVGVSHPLVTVRELVLGALSGLLALLCVAHAIRLRLSASHFESLNRSEAEDLERWLCPGMIRSDIVDELSRHGWRIGKIRSVLSGLSPVSRDAA